MTAVIVTIVEGAVTLTQVRRAPLAVAGVLAVLGFLLSLQFRVQQTSTLNQLAGIERAQDLAAQLRRAEVQRDALRTEIASLRSSAASPQTLPAESDTMREQLQQARIFAGLVALQGAGVVLTLNDSSLPRMPGENPNNYILHDEDILKVVNELKAAGAEALSINGQRLIDRSEIRCVGPTVTINGVRTAPPVVIAAIGDPVALENGLNMRGGVAENLRQWAIEVSVRAEEQVTVPAFTGSLKFQFAKANTPDAKLR